MVRIHGWCKRRLHIQRRLPQALQVEGKNQQSKGCAQQIPSIQYVANMISPAWIPPLTTGSDLSFHSQEVRESEVWTLHVISEARKCSTDRSQAEPYGDTLPAGPS